MAEAQARAGTAAVAARIDAAIESAVGSGRIVGAVVLVARDGGTIYGRAAGYRDREAGDLLGNDTCFLLSSLTKPIVSAAAMALVERNLLDLGDDVRRWLPEFRPRLADGTEPTITIRQLLTHTAGLGYRFLQPAGGPYERAGVSDGLDEPGLAMDEALQRIASAPLQGRPGAAWAYSVATDVLGGLLQKVAGGSLRDVVAQFVTGPLGLDDTSFDPPEPCRLAVPYAGGFPPRRMMDGDVVSFGPGAGIRFHPSRNFDAASFPSGGAGMIGTAPDFLKFLETLRGGGGPILSPASVRAMMSNQIGGLRVDLEATPAWGFGFGGAVLVNPELAAVPQGPGTWKWGGVYGHHWYVDPLASLSLVVLTNTAVEGMVGDFARDIMLAVYGAP